MSLCTILSREHKFRSERLERKLNCVTHSCTEYDDCVLAQKASWTFDCVVD